MRFSTTLAFFLLLCSVSLPAQQLRFITGAVIQGEPYVTAFAQGESGNYFFGSRVDHVNGSLSGNLTKTDQDGSLLPGFSRVMTDSHVLSVRELADGRILMAGWFTQINGERVGSVVRLNPDGTLDDTFIRWLDIKPYESVSRFVVQSTGKIVVVGSFYDYLGSGYFNIVRLNEDGSVDETFAKNVTDLPFVPFIEVNENDELLVSDGRKLFRLDADGGLHPGFTPPVADEDGHFYHFKFFTDNGILVAGSFDALGGVAVDKVARVNGDGSVDAAFQPVINASYINDLEVKNDGTFIVASSTGLEIFNASGSPLPASGIDVSGIGNIYLDNAERLIISGTFERIHGVERPFFVRLTNGFALDDSFDCYVTYTEGIRDILPQPDGKLVVAGFFHGINDSSSNIIRISLDGTVDNTFSTDLTIDYFSCLALQPDGKILVKDDRVIKRLLPTGQADPTFHSGTFGGYPTPFLSFLSIRKDKIYISGEFKTYDGQRSPGLVRLNMDGTLDDTFQSQLPDTTFIGTFDFQSDDRIIAAGLVPSSGGDTRLIRIQANGSADDSFSNGSFTYNSIDEIRIDSKDRIYVAGSFVELNSTAISSFAKLSKDGVIDHDFTVPYPDLLNRDFPVLELVTDNRIVLGLRTSQQGLLVVDSTGHSVEVEYAAPEVEAAFTTSYFDGRTLFLAGRMMTDNYQAVSGLAYVNFSTVTGSVEHLQASRTAADKVALTWENKFSNAGVIVIERSANSNTSFAFLHAAEATATSYEDVAVVPERSYYYRVRASNSGSTSAWSNEAFVKDTLIVGMEREVIRTVRVYPNPAGTRLFLESGRDFSGMAVVVDVTGKVIARLPVTGDSVDVSGLPPSMYILLLSDGKARVSYRFVKE